jgi:hypothetical protein
MTKDEWKSRCADRYMERAALTKEQATEAAQICFDEQDDIFSESAEYDPEQCADDDMDCWDAD